MIKIVSVTPTAGFCLEITLDNGHSVNLDMRSRMHTARFSLLADEDYFNSVTTDGTCLRWNNRVEISISEVFQLAQK